LAASSNCSYSQNRKNPLLAIRVQYPFSVIFPKYLNLLFITMFRIIHNIKLVLINTSSLKLNPSSPIWQLIFPLVNTQRKFYAIYFDLSNAFNLVPHSLINKLSTFGLSGGYVNWFRSYLSNRSNQARVSGVLSSPSELFSGVFQGSLLRLMLFNVFINDICNELPTLSIYFLLTISEFIDPFHLRTAICFSLILTPY
jgi:hypothetical protein